MPGGHSSYPPSAAFRWTSCTASLSFDRGDLPPERPSVHAARGTYLHEVAYRALVEDVHPLDLEWDDELDRLARAALPSHPEQVTVEESNDVYPYVDYVRELPGQKFYEQAVEIVPGLCWGTCDAIVVDELDLHVVDYKSGSGVEVFAQKNLQTLLYGVGAVRKYGFLYDLERVHHAIVQPSFGEPKVWSVSLEDQGVMFETVREVIDSIQEDDVEFAPSDVNCRWCPAKLVCTAVEDLAVQAARDAFKEPMTWGEKYALVPLLRTWCTDVEVEVKRRMLEKGEEVEGYKVVEGRRSRDWKSEKKARTFLSRFLTEEQLSTEPKFKSPAQVEATIKEVELEFIPAAQKKFEALIQKNRGAPTVAPEDDKRKEVTKADLAANDFEDVIEDAKKKRTKKKKTKSTRKGR